MIIDVNDMLFALSYALDCVERDVIGVTTNHGKRVAYLSVLMGRKLGMCQKDLDALAGLAIMHDNALTEFLHEEHEKKPGERANNSLLVRHCILGEQNIMRMPMDGEHKNIILYHHEHANGSGPFGKTGRETPLGAQLIHIADQIDANWKLDELLPERLEQVMDWVRKRQNIIFSQECASCILDIMDVAVLGKMQGEQLNTSLHEILVPAAKEYQDRDVKNLASVFANITDYKSKFTRTHSIGIAQKAERMGQFYHDSQEKITMLYLAGALHDIGKLAVDRDVLEKPDKLTDQEYRHIQNHAYYTYEILSQIHGMEEITKWASYHHEKLDGSGYPFGLKADELNQEERLLACLDIYQALTEDRPYKAGFTHEKTMDIMKGMVAKNLLDKKIVEDINQVFGAEI